MQVANFVAAHVCTCTSFSDEIWQADVDWLVAAFPKKMIYEFSCVGETNDLKSREVDKKMFTILGPTAIVL